MIPGENIKICIRMLDTFSHNFMFKDRFGTLLWTNAGLCITETSNADGKNGPRKAYDEACVVCAVQWHVAGDRQSHNVGSLLLFTFTVCVCVHAHLCICVRFCFLVCSAPQW